MRKAIGAYFEFSKRERTGIFVLLLLIFILALLPLTYPYFIPQRHYDPGTFFKEVAALKRRVTDSNSNVAYQYNKGYDESYFKHDGKPIFAEAALFPFDPNSLSAAGWMKLGVKEKTAATILKYISKGGRFRKAEDIAKIWGLSPAKVQQLLPYVSIKNESPVYKESKTFNNYKPLKYAPVKVDINLGDTTAYIALPGIGNKLANRIVNFRQKLGGFYCVEQVGETFGLPDSTFQKIKSMLFFTEVPLKQLNINAATIDELKIHPYIRYYLANAIFQFRAQHGNYAAVTDLKKIMIIDEKTYGKIEKYLRVN